MILMKSTAWSMCGLEKEEENLRKGPWTFGEDMKLIAYIRLNGTGRWNSVAEGAGLKRSGKSCRLRWLNYLRPDLKHGPITPKEQRLIFDLHRQWGNRWSRIAQSLPGRTDNEIKNHWRTHIKKMSREPIPFYSWLPASKSPAQIKAERESSVPSSGKSFKGHQTGGMKECYAEFYAPTTVNRVICDKCEVRDRNQASLTFQDNHQEFMKKSSDMDTLSRTVAEANETGVVQFSSAFSCSSVTASPVNVFSDSQEFLWDYNSIALWNLDDVRIGNVNEIVNV